MQMMFFNSHIHHHVAILKGRMHFWQKEFSSCCTHIYTLFRPNLQFWPLQNLCLEVIQQKLCQI